MGARRVGSDGEQPDGVLNGALIDSLVVDLGPELVGALVDLFVNDAPARIAALRAAFEAGNAREVAKVAHTMRSAAGSVGALAYASNCGRVERLAASGRLNIATADLDRLPADLAAAKAALAAALTTVPPNGGR
ncbi:MAG: Hpt domain-containing protein [Acidimicrobiales bacterium]